MGTIKLYRPDLAAPAQNAVAVTPSDTVNITATIAGAATAIQTCGLYIGGAGNVSVEMEGNGVAVVFIGCLVGSVLPICVTRVNATSTTATNIVALY